MVKKTLLALILLILSSVSQASSVFGGSTSSGTTLSGGIANRYTLWNTSSTLTNSQWGSDSNGNLLYLGSGKGTKDLALVAMNGTNTGLFLDATFGRPTVTLGGTVIAAFGGNPELYLYDGFGTANGMGIRPNGTIDSFGTGPTALLFSAPTGSNQSGFTANIAGIGTLWSVVATPNTNATDPLEIFHSGNYGSAGGGGSAVGDDIDFLTVNRGGGVSVGATWARANSFTAHARPDWSGPGGTTTANSSTTITGSGTNFTNDFGVGDYVALSSAASTFGYISAIASDTSMTVSTALGNGTSQTFIRRQAPFSTYDRSGNMLTAVDPFGRQRVRTATNGNAGTSTCNGSTEVTVNNTAITASTIIILTEQATGGTPLGDTYVSSRVAGTSFGFKCAVGDTSTVGYVLFEPI